MLSEIYEVARVQVQVVSRQLSQMLSPNVEEQVGLVVSFVLIALIVLAYLSKFIKN